MRAMLLVAVLFATPAVAATATDGGPLPHPTEAAVHLVWSDPSHALPAGFDAVAREVCAIFRPLGIHVAWLRADDRAASGGELNVILLPADPARGLHQRDTMGRVQRTRPSGLWIFAGRVRQTISLDRGPSLSGRFVDQVDYSRALGRVVAHELVHAIIPHEPHATRGLMQASLNRTVLTSLRIAIDARFGAAIVREIASRSAVDRGLQGARGPVTLRSLPGRPSLQHPSLGVLQIEDETRAPALSQPPLEHTEAGLSTPYNSCSGPG